MEKYNTLLELTIHRYDELNNRNSLIDNKNKSMIAFVGVLLSLEVNVVPTVLNMLNQTSKEVIDVIIAVLIILSICCYLISIINFISAVNYVKTFSEAPIVDELIQDDKDEKETKEIIAKTINAFNDRIKNNNKIIESKTTKAIEGFNFLKYGIISTVISIILFIIVMWR